jgi:hypothetical protein
MLVSSAKGNLKALHKCNNVNLQILGKDFWANLIVVYSEGIDVVLGRGWLSKFHGEIQYAKKSVLLTSLDGEQIEFVAAMPSSTRCSVHQLDGKSLEDIKVVYDYPDVFLDELPGMPPDRQVEFVIDLLSGTAPISKRPYRMSSDQLLELKKQIKELLEKGFICPSSSPWGAPVTFVERRMVLNRCVWITDCLMMLLSKISTHCPVLMICLIR